MNILASLSKSAEQTVNYTIYGGSKQQQQQLTSDNKQLIDIVQANRNVDIVRPDRRRGYKIIVIIPQHITVHEVNLVLERQGRQLKPKPKTKGQSQEISYQRMRMRKVKNNDKTFMLMSSKQLRIRTVQFVNSGMLIQQLQPQPFMRKFIINRQAKTIMHLKQQPYAIANVQKQSLIVSFTLHRFIGASLNSKIMWLSNNKRDQILTHTFGLIVRHGNEKQIIRVINENGLLVIDQDKNTKHTVNFGYQSDIDQIQLYLFIDHILNQNKEADDLLNYEENWMKMLPVAYGTINLQQIKNNILVGCEMKQMINNNQTLDCALNKVLIRQELRCLGAITMENRCWGFITIILQELSPVEIQTQNAVIFLTYTVEAAYKQEICGSTTEEKPVTKEIIKFTKNKLKFKFFENKKDDMYSLRVNAKVIEGEKTWELFQKRIDISQALQNPGQHPLVSHIKQVKGSKKAVQIQFRLYNSERSVVQEIEAIEKVQSINRVDIFSLKKSVSVSMIERMLSCQHNESLRSVMQQVRESIIYGKKQEYQIMQIMSYYLSYQNDNMVVKSALQTINLMFLKFPKVLNKLNNNQQLCSQILNNMKIIAQCKQVPPSSQYHKVTSERYEQALRENKLSRRELVQMQRYTMYSAKQILGASSVLLLEELLQLLSILLDKYNYFHNYFHNNFMKHIQDWNQSILYKDDKVFLSYLHIISKKEIINNLQNSYVPILQQIMDRGIGLTFGLELWTHIKDQNRQPYLIKLFTCLVDNFSKSNQNIQTFRALLNSIGMQKIKLPEELWEKAITKCLNQINNSSEVVQVNIYGELINKIDGMGHFPQTQKIKYIQILKRKQNQTSQKNKKLVYTNLLDKINKKSDLPKGKNEGTQTGGKKNHFYKKFLITS